MVCHCQPARSRFCQVTVGDAVSGTIEYARLIVFRGVGRVAASESADHADVPSCTGRGVLRNYILTYNYNITRFLQLASSLGCVFQLSNNLLTTDSFVA